MLKNKQKKYIFSYFKSCRWKYRDEQNGSPIYNLTHESQDLFCYIIKRLNGLHTT